MYKRYRCDVICNVIRNIDVMWYDANVIYKRYRCKVIKCRVVWSL